MIGLEKFTLQAVKEIEKSGIKALPKELKPEMENKRTLPREIHVPVMENKRTLPREIHAPDMENKRTLPREIHAPVMDAAKQQHELENKNELTEEKKAKIKEKTGWSDEIIDNIKNWEQYLVLKNAGLVEKEINGRKCLIKENIDLDYTDEDGVSNRERIARGLAPLDSKTGKPLELHHLGQKADSPLVELTEEEHRTGEYEAGKKNQSLWHDNTVETEVHGEGNNWDQERKAHWKARAENSKG